MKQSVCLYFKKMGKTEKSLSTSQKEKRDTIQINTTRNEREPDRVSQALKGKWISECKDYTGKPCLKNNSNNNKQTHKQTKRHSLT